MSDKSLPSDVLHAIHASLRSLPADRRLVVLHALAASYDASGERIELSPALAARVECLDCPWRARECLIGGGTRAEKCPLIPYRVEQPQ